MQKTDLSSFDNSWYKPGASFVTRAIWYFINAGIINTYCPFYGIKKFLLRMFGARVGKGVVIKPCVNIKYPWNLTIGDHAWIGENVWLDSLGKIVIGPNACLSQGATIITGNHNFSKKAFDLIIKEVILEEGVWIGAGAHVCPGVTCRSHSVLAMGSVAVHDLDAYGIYQGNPAVKVKDRTIE